MLNALVLGIIQGLTEFVPVSSSGHLVLADILLNVQDLDPAFNIFVQGGTVLSLLVYFAPRLATLRLTKNYIILILLAIAPAALAGILLEPLINELFSSVIGLAFGFLLTTIFLLASRVKAVPVELTPRRAVLIGLAQAAAILPGLSRSGSTLGSALILGISDKEAFNFSFLMSIPLITGASILSTRHMSWSTDMVGAYVVGFAAAAISGYFALLAIDKIMQSGKLYRFAPYTLLLSLFSLYLALS